MKSVDWTKWSAIAEMISSAAILITLVYLAVQTQQNTQALSANGRQAALQTELDFLTDTINYPEIYPGRVTTPDDGLDPETRVRRWASALKLVRMRETSWLQHQSGSLDDGTWDGYLSQFLSQLDQSTYVRYVWEEYSDQYNPEFVRAVNDLRN